MNVTDYHLDMDLLRSMATTQQHTTNTFNETNMFVPGGNLRDIHFMDTSYTSKPPSGSQSSTPLYQTTPNDAMDQDDILTPLISPAITPSFSYHPKLHNGDMDFSPLTSPAMIPQHYPFQANNTQPFYQHEQPDLHLISADEINTQYEELEKTKQMITRRLSELQNQQRRTQGIHQDHQLPTRNPTTYLAGYSDRSIPPRLKPVTPASLMRQHQQKPPRRKPKQPSTSHASPRALKPLLISPGLNPAPPSSDTEHNLMTRSNYQNLMEGKAAVLGFSPTIKSGIEVRRTAHKAAEQKRRDSLKEWFERLRHEVEEGYVKGGSKRQRDDDDDDDDEDDPSKPMSKVLLLRYAYEYIAQLKDSLVERDDLIASLMKK